MQTPNNLLNSGPTEAELCTVFVNKCMAKVAGYPGTRGYKPPRYPRAAAAGRRAWYGLQKRWVNIIGDMLGLLKVEWVQLATITLPCGTVECTEEFHTRFCLPSDLIAVGGHCTARGLDMTAFQGFEAAVPEEWMVARRARAAAALEASKLNATDPSTASSTNTPPRV